MNLSERVKKCFPIWQEQALIYDIENKEQMMDSTRGTIKTRPILSPYRWAITYFIEDEEK